MPVMDAHPLKVWLDAKGIKAYAFARQHGFHARTLYAYINGEVEEPKAHHMTRIEKVTKGEVTGQAQLDWFEKLRKANAKKEA